MLSQAQSSNSGPLPSSSMNPGHVQQPQSQPPQTETSATATPPSSHQRGGPAGGTSKGSKRGNNTTKNSNAGHGNSNSNGSTPTAPSSFKSKQDNASSKKQQHSIVTTSTTTTTTKQQNGDNGSAQATKPAYNKKNNRRANRPKPTKMDLGKQSDGAVKVRPKAPSEKNGQTNNDDNDEEEDDEDICFICAESSKSWCIGKCLHPICNMCGLRLRALYQKNECPMCKEDCPTVIFCSDNTKSPSDFPPSTPHVDEKLGIRFESEKLKEQSLNLLRFNCPLSDITNVTIMPTSTPTMNKPDGNRHCAYVASDWDDLRSHVSRTHQRRFCEICLNNLKLFSHEHILYNTKQLDQHINYNPPKSSNNTKGKQSSNNTSSQRQDDLGFRGHPLCEFCKINFFDDVALYRHLKHDHEDCHLCIRNGIKDQYFLDYPNLEHHYQTKHFMCQNQVCLEQKFVVFDSEMALQEHRLSEHLDDFAGNKRALAAARRIDSSFAFNSFPANIEISPNNSRRNNSNNRRGGGGGGRNQNQNNNASSSSSNNAAGNSGRRNVAFSGQLSQQQQETNGSAEINESQLGLKLPPSENDDLVVRHQVFLHRIKEITNNTPSKLTSFKLSVRTFRNSEMSAQNLIDSLSALFERNMNFLDEVIQTLTELLEDENDKRQELSDAWVQFQSQQPEFFPALSNNNSGASTPSWGYAGQQHRQQHRARTNAGSNNDFPSLGGRVPNSSTSRPTFASPVMPRRNDALSFPPLPNSSASSVSAPVSRAVTPRPHASTQQNNYFTPATSTTKAIPGLPSSNRFGSSATSWRDPNSPAAPPLARPQPSPSTATASTSSSQWRGGVSIAYPIPSSSASSSRLASNQEFPSLAPTNPGTTAAARRNAQKAAIFSKKGPASNAWFS